MNVGGLHVAAACIAMAVGMTVLVRRKGGSWHVALGRAYLVAMLAVNLPVLFRYEATGGPGPFHVLAVLSLTTTSFGWLSLQAGRRRGHAIEAHASFMTWSWIGVATAGLAQLANRQWPERSPWPVIIVVATLTGVGLAGVSRYISRQLRLPMHKRAESSGGTSAGP